MAEETCKWGEMQNLPAAPAVPLNLAAGIAELGRLAALCPHGWVELMVDQGRSPSTPDDPGEGYQDVQAICVWGIGPDIVERLDELIDDATADGSALSKVPAGSFVAIARVVRRDTAHSGGCPCCSEEIRLDVGWGIDGAAVYSLPPEDDAPVVCGGGAEPHAPDCIDERIRLDQEERFERGEMNDPTDDLGDEEDDHG